MNEEIKCQILSNMEKLQKNIKTGEFNKNLDEFVENTILSIPVKIKGELDGFVKDSVLILKDQSDNDIESITFGKNDKFWKSIFPVIHREIRAYNEMDYLRSDNIMILETIKSIFDSYVLVKNDIVEIDTLSAEEVFNISKHLGSIARTQIKNSFSRVYFVKYFSEKYDFTEIINRFIFDVIEANREILVPKYLFEQLNYIERCMDDLTV